MLKLPRLRHGPLPRIGLGALAAAWYGLVNAMFHPYRPEQHYMRGPGPKWQEKSREG